MNDIPKFGPLQSCGDEELIQELFARYDHCIFCGLKVSYLDPGKGLTRRRWKGNSATSSGLALQVSQAINSELFSNEEDYNE